jgi:hypothetical protein
LGVEWELAKREKELLWLRPSEAEAELTKSREARITGPLIATKSSRITFVAEKYWFGKQANGRRSVISHENSQLVRREQFAAAIKHWTCSSIG